MSKTNKDLKYVKSICYDCIWCREQPLRCIVDGKNRILDIKNLPKTCKNCSEHW